MALSRNAVDDSTLSRRLLAELLIQLEKNMTKCETFKALNTFVVCCFEWLIFVRINR